MLTSRGRRVAVLGTAAATTAAIVLIGPGLGGAETPLVTLGAPGMAAPTGPVPTDPALTDPALTDQTASDLMATTAEPMTAPATAPSMPAPVVVNGREQPPRVEPPTAASGRLDVVPGTAAAGPGAEVLTYRVEVEVGLPFDGPAFAAAAHATLADPRGWAASGYAFQRVDTGEVDFRLVLASPSLTDQMCAPLLTLGEVSCRNGDAVVLNALRWGVGIEDYGGDVATYREYLVNHEVGHRLGRGHVDCPGAGTPAPVMVQQTYGLDACTANAWPLPGE